MRRVIYSLLGIATAVTALCAATPAIADHGHGKPAPAHHAKQPARHTPHASHAPKAHAAPKPHAKPVAGHKPAPHAHAPAAKSHAPAARHHH